MTELELYNKFAEAAMLNKEHDPWRKRRDKEMSVAMFEIVLDPPENWWYAPFVGVQFLGKIRWDIGQGKRSGIKTIREVTAIQTFKNVYINEGRDLAIEHIVLI